MLDAVVFVQAQSQIDAVLGFLRREERIAGEIPPRAEKFNVLVWRPKSDL